MQNKPKDIKIANILAIFFKTICTIFIFPIFNTSVHKYDTMPNCTVQQFKPA